MTRLQWDKRVSEEDLRILMRIGYPRLQVTSPPTFMCHSGGLHSGVDVVDQALWLEGN